MIISKEFKSMFTFLTKVYGILNKGGDNTIIYMNENAELMYQAFCISGKIKITKDNVSVLNEDIVKNKFYELSRLPRDRFELKAVDRSAVTDEMKEALESLTKRFSGGTFVCEISDDEHRLISKITRLTERYINDSYLSMMNKFSACEVWQHGSYITLMKNEFIEKEYVNIEEEMCFYCETYQSVDENIQGKMKFDEEVKFGGAA